MTPEERTKAIINDVYREMPTSGWRIEKAIRDAIAEEREACARVAELSEPMWPDTVDTGNMWRHQQGITIAAAIRARV